jgi:hypothetical protein
MVCKIPRAFKLKQNCRTFCRFPLGQPARLGAKYYVSGNLIGCGGDDKVRPGRVFEPGWTNYRGKLDT